MQHKINAKISKLKYYLKLLNEYKLECQDRFLNDIIPKEFAYNFAKIASFRNFLAHDYEKIDYLVICDEVLNRLDDIEQYLNYIEGAC